MMHIMSHKIVDVVVVVVEISNKMRRTFIFLDESRYYNTVPQNAGFDFV